MFETAGKVGFGVTTIAEVIHVAGNIVATGTITSTYSDARLKKDVITIPEQKVWEVINNLDGYTFRWNDEVLKMDEYMARKHNVIDTGLIAQEVGAAWPFAMVQQPSISPDGITYNTISYDKLFPILLNAIKSLKKEIEELKNNPNLKG
jgi:hypothetical protein